MEVANAVRRQRRTGAVTYSNDFSPTSNIKQVITADPREGIQPSPTQYIITSSHSLDRRKHSYDNSNFSGYKNGTSYNIDSRNAYHDSQNTISEKSHHVVSPFSTGWTRYIGNGDYVSIDDKPSKTTVSSHVNSRAHNFKFKDEVIQGGHIKSLPVNPQLNFPEVPNSFSKSSDRGVMAARSKMETSFDQSQSASDIYPGLPKASSKGEKHSDLHIDVYILPSQKLSASAEDNVSAFSKVSSVKSSADSLDRNLLKQRRFPQISKSFSDSKAPNMKQGAANRSVSFLQFADSILGAVGSDLNQIYELCQSRIRYSDLIDMSKRDLIQENRREKSQIEGFFQDHRAEKSQNGTCSPATHASTFPTAHRHQHTLPSLPNLHSPTLSSRKVRFLSDLPEETRQEQILEDYNNKTKIFLPVTSSEREVARGLEEPVEEPDIDYDKDVTIVIESDDTKLPEKATRSILKNCRIDYTSSHKTSSHSFDDFKSYNRKVAAYAELQNTTLARRNASSVANSAETTQILASQTEGKSTMEYFNKDKGRLVRFSTDNQVYEFAPLEPIVSQFEQET